MKVKMSLYLLHNRSGQFFLAFHRPTCHMGGQEHIWSFYKILKGIGQIPLLKKGLKRGFLILEHIEPGTQNLPTFKTVYQIPCFYAFSPGSVE